MKSIFVLAAMLLVGGQAQATVPGTCGMDFEVSIKDELFSLEYTGQGTGHIVCTDLNGVEHKSDIEIEVTGWGPGVGEYTITGVAGGLNIASAKALEGDYYAPAVELFAVNFSMGFTGKKNGLSFDVRVGINEEGLGLFAGATNWTIRVKD